MFMVSFVVRFTPISRSWCRESMTMPGAVKVCTMATSASRGYPVTTPMAQLPMLSVGTSFAAQAQQR